MSRNIKKYEDSYLLLIEELKNFIKKSDKNTILEKLAHSINLKEFRNSPNTKACVELLWEDKILKKPVFSADSRPTEDSYIQATILNNLYAPLLESVKKDGKINIPTVKKNFKLNFQIWTGKRIGTEFFIFLPCLKSYINKVKIDDLVLRQISDQERASIFSKINNLLGYNEIKKSLTDFVITNTKIITHEQFTTQSRRLITALRLLKFDTLDHSSLVRIGTLSSPLGYGISDMQDLLSHHDPFSSGNFTILKTDLSKLRKNYNLLNKHENSLKMVLRRYNFARSRTNIEDKIVDYAITLESFLLRGNKKEEISDKFASHAAFLIRKRKSFKETHKMMKLLYNARSDIVHNGASFSEKEHKFKLNEMEELINLIIICAMEEMSLNPSITIKNFGEKMREGLIDYIDKKLY